MKYDQDVSDQLVNFVSIFQEYLKALVLDQELEHMEKQVSAI